MSSPAQDIKNKEEPQDVPEEIYDEDVINAPYYFLSAVAYEMLMKTILFLILA